MATAKDYSSTASASRLLIYRLGPADPRDHGRLSFRAAKYIEHCHSKAETRQSLERGTKNFSQELTFLEAHHSAEELYQLC